MKIQESFGWAITGWVHCALGIGLGVVAGKIHQDYEFASIMTAIPAMASSIIGIICLMCSFGIKF